MPRIALITRALAPYHKAVQEAFADALGPDSELRLFYPSSFVSVFSRSGTEPIGPNISTAWIDSIGLSGEVTRFLSKWRSEAFGTQLPSIDLWRKLREFDPDLVWVHELSPYTTAGMMLAKCMGKPMVMSSDVGCSNQHFFPRMVRLWHSLWGRFADGIIAATPAARIPLSGEGRPTVEAFHAADSRKWTPREKTSPNSPVTFVFTGRLIKRKGIDFFLSAAHELKTRGVKNWQIVLVGADPDGWAASLVKENGLNDCVRLTGQLESEGVQQELRQADVFVLPSREDTYAAVVHEAACLCLPLLVSKYAGASEALVEDGVNGYRLDPKNITDFADKLEMLCAPDLRQRMSRDSRATAETFSAHQRGPAIRSWMQEHWNV